MKIAVFITRRDYEVVYSLLKGIHERAKQDNVDVVVFFCGETNNIHTPDSIGEFQIYGLAQLTDYDGAIIVAQQILFKEILEPLVDMVKKSGIPAVCIGKEIDGMMSVDIDNYQSMFNIVEHIMSVHNPETILYVEGLDGAENHLQTQAAKDAIHKYGKELTEDDIIREKYCYQDGFELAKEMYEKAGKQKLPKAIICSHDIVAHGIMDFFLYETDDVEIPDDILITGYNEQRDNRRHFYSLTTIGKPRTDMGYAACDLLLNKEYAGRMITKYFAGEMCLGKSCGCEKESESILQKSRSGDVQCRTLRNVCRQRGILRHTLRPLCRQRSLLHAYHRTLQLRGIQHPRAERIRYSKGLPSYPRVRNGGFHMRNAFRELHDQRKWRTVPAFI